MKPENSENAFLHIIARYKTDGDGKRYADDEIV